MRELPSREYFKNKRILVRVDFNVGIKNNRVVDDFDLVRALKTIKYLYPQSHYLLLISHLGNPQEGGRLGSLASVAKRLAELLKKKVYFVFGEPAKLREFLLKLPRGSVVLLENIRFYTGEYNENGYVNSAAFARKLAGLGDCYVNEAFGESHRWVSSVVAITRYLPSFAGFNLAEEARNLSRIRDNPQHPLVVVLGGAKLKTKLPLIKKFAKKAEAVLLGGALANTFLKALGLGIGRSIYEKEFLAQAKQLAELDSVYLPVDFQVAQAKTSRVSGVAQSSLPQSKLILDIGPETIQQYQKIISTAKTVFWNGPMGYYENPIFSQGTKEIAKAILANQRAFKVIGGGETLAFLREVKLPQSPQTFISTGGGAMLAFLAGESLPGLKALE